MANSKLNRRAGSSHADISASAGEYSKLSSAKGAPQLYPNQQPAPGGHSASMSQPPHGDSSSFATNGAHTGQM